MCWQRDSQLGLASRLFAASPYLDLTNQAKALSMLHYAPTARVRAPRAQTGPAWHTCTEED